MKEAKEAKKKKVGSDLQNFQMDGNFYITGEVDESIAKEITAPLIERIMEEKEKAIKEPIKIYISSYGGYLKDAYDLISWFEYAKSVGVPIHTYVTSVAFSAASLIAVAGHKRFGSSRAFHGLHFARGFEYSHNPEMTKRNADNSNFLQNELVKIYQKYTKLKDIPKLLLADNYMVNGGTEMKKLGLIDEIL